ncbi:hypothetical protein [Pseudomonas sp. PONIH3]|uniref:hypothetical protein n=1 Tax=Pseudomonas sp. PONIH3 TaxID=1636610 RepID=UPI003D2AD677
MRDSAALSSDPDGRATVLEEMAYAVNRRRGLDAGVLSDMLELTEAARIWALLVHEEAFLNFGYQVIIHLRIRKHPVAILYLG